MRVSIIFAAAALAGSAMTAGAVEPEILERGAYLARIMDCGGCHTPRGPDGAPIIEAGLSGANVGFEIPGVGVFWPPNLTPDATGLAGWSEDEVIAAVRDGVRPDGRMLVPVMPWPNYAAMTDEDARALAAYLLAQAPVEHAVPAPVGPGDAPPAAPFYRVVVPD